MAAARIIRLQEAELAAHRRRTGGTPLSGGDRKALKKELHRASAIHGMLYVEGIDKIARGAALVKEGDRLVCEAFNERLWSLGGPLQPSPTIGQAINCGWHWLEVRCTRCKSDNSIDMRRLRQPPTREIWQLEASLRCDPCREKNWRPPAVIRQIARDQHYRLPSPDRRA